MYDVLQLPAHRHLPHNRQGRDLFIGDLHGGSDLLQRGLDSLNFDPCCDRLFSVGDLIDRGDASFDCLHLLSEPWFYAVLGNHERFLLEFDEQDAKKVSLWARNGGDWWYQLTPREQAVARQLASHHLSLTLSVDTPLGTVGLVHAEYPFDTWPITTQPPLTHQDVRNMIWERAVLREKQVHHTQGVDLLLSGHTPVNHPTQLGNQLFIDTGSIYPADDELQTPGLTFCECRPTALHFTHVEHKQIRHSQHVWPSSSAT